MQMPVKPKRGCICIRRKKEEVKNSLTKIFSDSNAAAYKDQPKEIQAYLTYLVSDVLTNGTGVVMSKSINTKDDTYKAWKDDESINVYSYLNYAISKNWIDTSLLKDYIKSNEQYSDSSEVYQGIINYILDYVDSDNSFDKLIYRYMIKSGTITGRQVCMMLYEQGILDQDDEQYNGLKAGNVGAYDFMRSKIQSLEITPGQLGLEPCTGSLVATDPNTGEVLACVSYPGYDNNRLANTMDSDYYSKLLTNQSRPFYNNATQEKTAPGSTYKPLSAIAGLTEGVIDVNTYLPCAGVYKKVTPNPKCWIYLSSHGNLNVSQGIQHSCNDFSMKSVTDWGSIMPVIQSWTVIPQMERVHRIIIQANVVLQNFKNMRKNSVLEILRVWKFLNLTRRYPMTTLYYLLSDRVPTTILPVSLQDISQQLQMMEPYTT